MKRLLASSFPNITNWNKWYASKKRFQLLTKLLIRDQDKLSVLQKKKKYYI